jgi:hypothetical protein
MTIEILIGKPILAVGKSVGPIAGAMALTFLGVCVYFLFQSRTNRPNSIVRVGGVTLAAAGALFLVASVMMSVKWQMCLLYGFVPFSIGCVTLFRQGSVSRKK